MKYKLSFIFAIMILLWVICPIVGHSEEIRVPATTISSLQGGWNAVQNVTVYGITYPNAYTVSNGHIDYVVSRKYRFFVAEVGVRDDGRNGGYRIFGNNKEILTGNMDIGEPLKLIKIPISDYVRFSISSNIDILWVNPSFIK